MVGLFARSIGKRLVYLLSLAGLLSLVLFTFLFRFWVFLHTPGSLDTGAKEVAIQQGMSADAISRALASQGIVSDARFFSVLCWYRKAAQKLKAGEYAFLRLSTPDQILEQITAGRVIVHKVTLPEGSTVKDVARILGESGLAPRDEILRLSTDPEAANSMGIDASGLEGYLFPETYYFRKTQSSASILRAMVDQFRKRLPDSWADRSKALGFSLHQLVILASLIEKEAVVDSERPIIAAVFINRLKRGMPLQSDPTAVYDLDGFSGPVESAHLKRQSPYNTYVVKGLPIGPICNPGAKSIRAAFHPEEVAYLYFVSNDDGTHYFSETAAEHHKAVSRYREKRRIRLDRGSEDETVADAATQGEENAEKQPGEVTEKQGGRQIDRPADRQAGKQVEGSRKGKVAISSKAAPVKKKK